MIAEYEALDDRSREVERRHRLGDFQRRRSNTMGNAQPRDAI